MTEPVDKTDKSGDADESRASSIEPAEASDSAGEGDSSADTAETVTRFRGLSRRTLLGAGAVGAAGALGVATGAVGYRVIGGGGHGADVADSVPFWASDNDGHQAGIATPAQDRLHFVSFDVITEKRDELIAMLRKWTVAAARMVRGQEAGSAGVSGELYAPPDDTGEALGLPPSQLTITIGFGPSLFDGRFGLSDRRPAALAELPHFPGDALEETRCGGDIAIQACANDPQVAVHAVRNLIRLGFGTVQVRWSQLGFGRTSSTSKTQATPRNLMGFKDGTDNLKSEDSRLMRDHVWVPRSESPTWMVDGSYLVARRIRMHIETWDRTTLNEQQGIFARFKRSGAPLSSDDKARAEFDAPDFTAVGAASEPVIPADSHVRLAHHAHNAGARILRRGYNFADGSDGLGKLDAGLFFLAYQRDPRTQFVRIQRNLARSDGLNEYIQHVGSALFACPPGPRTGQYWGQELFS